MSMRTWTLALGAGAVLAAGAWSLAPLPADAQSFNCRLAKKAAEVLICQNAELSSWDESLAEVYAIARTRLNAAGKRDLQSSQRRWIARRDACGRDARCIERLYDARMVELQAIAYR